MGFRHMLIYFVPIFIANIIKVINQDLCTVLVIAIDTVLNQNLSLNEVLRLPHTGPDMRVAGLRGGVILVFFVGSIGKLSVIKVVHFLA